MMANIPSNARHRTSRRVRRKRGVPQLRSRDVDILLALAKMRLLRTSDIARLFFSATGTAQKRLRRLFDAGLVRAFVPELAAENRYALTALGHALLVEAAGDDDVPPLLPTPRVDSRRLTHLDMLNGFRIVLARSAPDLGASLNRFRPEWELRAEDPHAAIVPDALLTLDEFGKRYVVALEVDVGTESPQLVLKKLERYAAARIQRRAIFGVSQVAPLILVQTTRRARAIARIAKTSHPEIAIGVARVVVREGTIRAGFSRLGQVPLDGGVPNDTTFELGLLGVITRDRGAGIPAPAHSSIRAKAEVHVTRTNSAEVPRATASRTRNAKS